MNKAMVLGECIMYMENSEFHSIGPTREIKGE